MTSICWGTTKNCSITVGKNNDITIRRGAKLHNVKINISGAYNSLIIGHEVTMNGGTITVEGENTHVRIGHRTELSTATVVAGGGEPVLIGDDCKFSQGALVSNLGADPAAKAKPIFVPSGTVVGAGARIFKGTLIGEGAAIPPNAVVAGAIPGKVLSTWAPERILNAASKREVMSANTHGFSSPAAHAVVAHNTASAVRSSAAT